MDKAPRHLAIHQLRISLLILTLLMGFLQVQTVFACKMMNEVFHGECCCKGNQHCADFDCDDPAVDSAADQQQSCCDVSVELSVDTDDIQAHVSYAKGCDSEQIRSNVDPPPAVFLIAPPCQWLPSTSAQRAAATYSSARAKHAQKTYLTTQRLRI